MKEQYIKALKIAPLERPKICYLENNLESLQKAVSIGAEYVGLIEILDLDERTCIVCNEEGKFNGSRKNRVLLYKDLSPNLFNPNKAKIFDTIYHPLLIKNVSKL